ncbi:PQQ-dependent dehydrogenase, methanol/ethanol family [Myxococcota bacterium]|nr:PQQ-dependent dehydrogenase, methanol/ethanol family [Myxococcota bacterium]
MPEQNRVSKITYKILYVGMLSLVMGCGDSQSEAPTADGHTDAGPRVAAPIIGQIDDARIENAASEPGNWLAYGRDYSEQRFSPLEQVNRSSVGRLGLAWMKDMGSNFAQEATPIVVDDTMFFTSSWSIVYAADARTGETRWRYDPEVPREFLRKACCGPVNRGVAVYKGRVYVGSLDGRLIALDAGTGQKVWEVDTVTDHGRNYSITGAPRAARGKVFIGNGGAEFGVRGYVTAYDANTGQQVWRFFNVPGDPSLGFENPALEMAAKTWKGGEWWKIGGGGTAWNSLVFDPDFNNLYIGVGNGSPWTRVIRSPGGGDNLFLASIVAVDADTGAYKWHYQTTPGDNWDYTAVQDMMLAELEVDGVMRKVLMQAPKNGFFYVLDRSDGKLLRAHPFVPTTWATHIDMVTGRPVENAELDYLNEPKWILPGPLGGHNWQSMSFDASTRTVYFPAQEHPLIYQLSDEYKQNGFVKRNPSTMNLGLEIGRLSQIIDENVDAMPASAGYLKAFDPLTGEEKWVHEHLHYWNGGALATRGGLVFQGDAMGNFSAYHSDTGEILWQFQTYTSILAPPISFEIDDRQYVSVMTGAGGGDHFNGYVNDTATIQYGNFGRMLVFALDATEEIPVPEALDRQIPIQPEITASAEEIQHGDVLYHGYCAPCHGINAASVGVMPDLRLMRPSTHQTFHQIVLDGVRSGMGMAGFSDDLTPQDANAIHAYLISRANRDRQAALE